MGTGTRSTKRLVAMSQADIASAVRGTCAAPVTAQSVPDGGELISVGACSARGR